MIETPLNTASRFAVFSLFLNEILQVVFDCKYMLLLILVLVCVDCRFAHAEANKRYDNAQKQCDEVLKKMYEWRTSKAIRKTCNKFIDYVLILCMGALIGLAALDKVGINYYWGVIGAMLIPIVCETFSIGGHYLYLRGIVLKSKSAKEFGKAVVVSMVKKKSQDLGEAIEEGFNSVGEDTESKQE